MKNENLYDLTIAWRDLFVDNFQRFSIPLCGEMFVQIMVKNVSIWNHPTHVFWSKKEVNFVEYVNKPQAYLWWIDRAYNNRSDNLIFSD